MRLKIIAGNLIIVLVVGVVAFFLVRGAVANTLGRQVAAEVSQDAVVFDRLWRQSAFEFISNVEDRARAESVRGSLSSVGDSRRRRVFEAANETASWFESRGGRPTIVVITDGGGVVVARNQDQNRLHGTLLSKDVRALDRALTEGRSQHDVWLKGDEGKLLQIAVSPVRNDQGMQIGAILVGFDLSAALATKESGALGSDVAFLRKDAVYSSSLDGASDAALQKSLFDDAYKARTQGTLGGERGAFAWSGELDGDEWMGTVGRLALTSAEPVGFAVVVNRTEATGLASAANTILVLTVVGMILVLVYGFFIGGMFQTDLEEIEEVVLAVINGNAELRIDMESAEYGGLAYRINQLINVFTGVSEGDETGAGLADASGDWAGGEGLGGGAAVPAGAAAGGTADRGGAEGGGVIDDPAVAQVLGAEPEAQYQKRIYDEYTAAKAKAGESVQNLSPERFGERLTRNAESLQKKHGVRLVRFVVEVSGGVVALKPVLIR